MSKLLAFGFHSVNEFGQVNVGSYAQAHPVSTLIFGLGMAALFYLIVKVFLE